MKRAPPCPRLGPHCSGAPEAREDSLRPSPRRGGGGGRPLCARSGPARGARRKQASDPGRRSATSLPRSLFPLGRVERRDKVLSLKLSALKPFGTLVCWLLRASLWGRQAPLRRTPRQGSTSRGARQRLTFPSHLRGTPLWADGTFEGQGIRTLFLILWGGGSF